MTTIQLSDEQAATLTAKAAAEGLTLEAWIQKLAETEPAPHIADLIVANMRGVPEALMRAMPEDGASQHDHYIYGLPKRDL